MKTKKIFTIGEPCHEDWQSMTPTEKGRYCDVCAKCVIDLRGKSQTEIQDLYVANEGNLCGTMSTTQYKESQQQVAEAKAKLEKKEAAIAAITTENVQTVANTNDLVAANEDAQAAERVQSRFNISRTALRRMQIFAASFIAAFGMFWNSTVKAQTRPHKVGKIKMPVSSRAIGVVMHNGKSVSGAAVYAYHRNSGERHETRTDAQGRFYFRDLTPGEWSFSAWDGHDLEGSAVRTLRHGDREEILIEMDVAMMMGDIAPLEPMEVPEIPEEVLEPELIDPVEEIHEVENGEIEMIVPGGIEPVEIEEIEEFEVGIIEVEEIEPEVMRPLGGISFIEVEETTIPVKECQPTPMAPTETHSEIMVDGGITFVEVEVAPEEATPVIEEITPVGQLIEFQEITPDHSTTDTDPVEISETTSEEGHEAVNEAEAAQELKIASEGFEVTVKPVPTRTDFTIRIDKSVSEKPIELLLFSTDGKLVRTGVINGSQGSTARMDISMLPAGVYFLKGLQNEYLFEEKILKL